MEFVKNKEFFVGIDSDGTVFDSMKIKHTDSFIPAAIETFSLQNCAEEFKEIAERINLYSLDRGKNRFITMLYAFEELDKKGLATFPELSDFKEFLDSDEPLSNDGLVHWISEHPSDFNEQILRWSRLGDVYFEKYTVNIPPFDGVLETIKYMSQFADIMVVSSAALSGLKKDWENAGLTPYLTFIAGQEFGSKAQQLEFAKQHGYEDDKILMIGDALGDYSAAKKVNASFYPIVPKGETESWKALKNIYFDRFVSGEYTGQVQDSLYKEFHKILCGG